jgi:predicted transcriptional regulator
MKDTINLELKQEIADNLLAFSQLLHKDINIIVEEALEQYLEREQQKLINRGIEEDATMTNLDYDEFWDGLDLG